MKERRKLLNLNDYGTTGGDIEQIQKDIYRCIRPKFFEFNSMWDFFYETLRFIKPVNKSVKNNPDSIKRNIQRVLQHFFGPARKTDNLTKDFEEWILGFDKVPKLELNELLPNVREDLKYVNDLVIHYEEQPEVISFVESRKIHFNQKTKTLLDFYFRCLGERQKILDYFLEGVYDRAIQRARANPFPSPIITIFQSRFDYPYETGLSFYHHTLDYRKIDNYSHRITEISVRELPQFRKLYQTDKEKFYKQLFKHRSKEEIFSHIFFNLDYVPLNKDRLAIFKELQRLYNQKKWLAFYALALPQVEGLFAEMVTSANPDSGVVKKSLPHKVKTVRPDYSGSNIYFDYYEYELPIKRNEFSHSGYINNYKLHAYDILTDLEHVLAVFASLENPLVKITKILKGDNEFMFSDYQGFNEYFQLLNSLPEQKRNNKLKESIIKFNDEFLKKEVSIEYTLQEAVNKLELSIPEIQKILYMAFDEFPKDWKSIHKPKIEKVLRDPIFRQKAEETFRFNGEDIKTILSLGNFLNGSLKHIYNKNIPDFLSTIFTRWDKLKGFSKWLNEFENLVNNEN